MAKTKKMATKKTAAKSTKKKPPAKKATSKTTASKTVASKKSAAKAGTTSKRSTKKKSASKKSTADKTKKSPIVVMDRRTKPERRTTTKEETTDAVVSEKGTQEEPVKEEVQLERRAKVNRRRQIDPTTCERDYTDQEIEFMQALDAYKHANGRMFPTCSEILEVLRSLGYERGPAEHTTSLSGTSTQTETPFDEESDDSLADELAWQQSDEDSLTV